MKRKDLKPWQWFTVDDNLFFAANSDEFGHYDDFWVYRDGSYAGWYVHLEDQEVVPCDPPNSFSEQWISNSNTKSLQKDILENKEVEK